MADKPDIITVKGTKDDSKVVLWERDEAHPDGEIFVVNDGKEYKVAETAAVKRLIGEGTLSRVNWNSRPQAKEDKKEAGSPSGAA